MKKITLAFGSLFCTLLSMNVQAQVPVKPSHVVFVLEENYSYSDITSTFASYAPVINSLIKDSLTYSTVNFTQMFAITHPSEPNYLELFSGSNQGVTVDESGPDANAPFDDCNMGSSLISAGYTFIGYSETQPSPGWFNTDNGNYYTKHCPWINWMNGDNGVICTKDSIPVGSDLPFAPVGTYYPDSNHYSSLPTVSWVIPNIIDDMHDPSTPSTAISNGDTWFKTNMMPLVRWAINPANNTLVIVVWDEDDELHSNNIPMLFCGSLVKPGNCTTKINLYNLLKTVEDMYGLPACGSSAGLADVPASVWRVTGINSITNPVNKVTTWPVPASSQLNIKITSIDEGKTNIDMYDVTGRLVKEMSTELKPGDNSIIFNTDDLSNGIYSLAIKGEKINVCNKIVIAK